MRIERLLTLEVGDEAGQGSSTGQGRLARGTLALGDRPDWIVEVSVRRAIDPFAAVLLDAGARLLASPIEGLAPVLDLGRVGLEAYVAYRWAPGRSLAVLLEEGLDRDRTQRIVDATADVLRRVKATLPDGALTPGVLALEQIYVESGPGRALRVCITDWSSADGKPLDIDRLTHTLADRALALAASSAAPVPRALAFDAALGAALSTSDDADDAPAIGPPTAERPKTRALPQTAWPVVEAARPSPTPSSAAVVPAKREVAEHVEVAPRSGRVALPVIGALGGAAVVVVALMAFGIGTPTAAVKPTPSPIPSPSAIPLPSPSPSPSPIPSPSPKPLPHLRASTPGARTAEPTESAGPATLSVRSDVAAGVYLDGHYVGEAPLARFAIEPGHHRLRLEALEGALRLLPREESLTLAAGQHQALTIDLK